MPSKEDYLDNLLKRMTHTDGLNPEEEKPIDENIQPEAEPEPEPEIPEAESELEPEISEVEPESEPGIPEAESELEPEISESEFELEPEISEPEPEPEISESGSEAFMQESGTENISEAKTDYQEEILNAEENGTPDTAEGTPNAEGSEGFGIEESEVSDIVEDEIPNIEQELELGISMPEEEAEPELGMSMPEEAEPELGTSMPEEEQEPESGISMPENEPEISNMEELEIPDMEEPEIPNMEELEVLDMEEPETPDMEEPEIPNMEESELPDLEGAEFPETEENELTETGEDEISDIEELIASMDENNSDMEEKNMAENDEILDMEDAISDIVDFAGLKEEEPEAESLNSDRVPDLDDVTEMSEDDIEKLLSNGFVEEGVESADLPNGDVLDMLEGTADDDLQDIQDMLQKSDNNEAVDDDIMKLLQGVPEDENSLEEKILSEDGRLAETDSEELDALIGDPKKQKALEKKRLKEEKAAAKKAAKEAAKAKKDAKKRAKKAKKKRQNKNVQDIPVENENGEELLFDRDELDRLVSKAGQIGDEEPETEDAEEESGNAGGDDFGLNLNDLFAGDEGSGEDALQALTATDTGGQSDSGDSEAAREKKKEKKEKKEKAEKTGFLSKILSFLMEEDEEDEKGGNLRLSEENQGILNDLDKQGKTVKGGKGGTGGKKDKKKDNKKEKPKKEAKPKKAPKPKAEKPPKEPEPYVPPRKRLTPKKVFPVVLLGITVAAAILIFVNVSTDYVDKRAAKTAYYNGDYMACYQNLNGKELNETESVMYGRSESILYIRLWYREYEMFVEDGAEVEALDSLIQTVKDYPMLYEYATKWHAEGDVYAVYADILNILLNKYGITELQAKEIAKERDDLKYTRMVVALTEGKPYGSWNQTEASVEDDSLPHELPEESDLGQGNFVDNR